MIFTGHYEHTIDAKNRLAVPRKYRNRLDPEADGSALVLAPGRPMDRLWLYTEREFERLASRTKSTLIPSEDQLFFDQIFFPLAEYLDLDSQGRVLIPDKMLDMTKLPREVMVCGVRDHIEVRSREAFNAEMQSAIDKFSEYQLRAQASYGDDAS